MPRLSVWFIRASLVYLWIGFTWGALMLVNSATEFYPPLWSLQPSHIEFLFLGWFLQLALGVAYWILPRYIRGEPRGKEPYGWVALILLNIGLVASAAGSLASLVWVPLVGHLLEAAAAVLFAAFIWKRIKATGM